MLGTRVITALVLVPLVLAAVFGLDARGWGIVSLGIVSIAAFEWARLADFRQSMVLLFVAGTLLSGLALLFAPIGGFDARSGWPNGLVDCICAAATLFWTMLVPVWLYRGWRVTSRPALLLVGWLLLVSTWLAVVQLQARSTILLLGLMAIVWIADTAAYFFGRRFGRRKLAPSISPGKTWEGAIGALAAVSVYALGMLAFARDAGYTGLIDARMAASWVAIVLALAVLSIQGDLFESHLKRSRGVKDSGSILPGHGGVLDRIDALLAAMPASALVAHLLIR